MPGSGEIRQQPALMTGRELALARVRGLVDPAPRAGQVLLMTGDAGMGKTVLVADAADRARRSGMRVLSVTGRESESNSRSLSQQRARSASRDGRPRKHVR
jgi:KaiC/GvpD/RAD55 family RecA-like ATPase